MIMIIVIILFPRETARGERRRRGERTSGAERRRIVEEK